MDLAALSVADLAAAVVKLQRMATGKAAAARARHAATTIIREVNTGVSGLDVIATDLSARAQRKAKAYSLDPSFTVLDWRAR